MKVQIETLNKLYDNIIQFAQENLSKIEELNINPHEEINSTYLGFIVRQITMNIDLKLLLNNDKHIYHTSQFILLRCLIDDFIHLAYISNNVNSDELIVNFNADAYDKNFKKIKDLATLNEEKLGGNYQYYPTFELMEEVKEKMKNNPLRSHYLSDVENFKFKTFKNTGQIIRDLGNENNAHQLTRAYFIWRKLSDFVHYSNLAFEEESRMDPGNDYTYNEFAEVIFYSFLTSSICLDYFKNKYGFEIIDSNNLIKYYENAGH